jgi:hypothetical protein
MRAKRSANNAQHSSEKRVRRELASQVSLVFFFRAVGSRPTIGPKIA